MFSDSSSASLWERSLVQGNVADFGGAFSLGESSVHTLYDMRIVENKAERAHGGAVYILGSSRLVAQRTMFSGNQAQLEGGVFSVQELAFVTTIGCTFTASVASTNGGHMSLHDLSEWTDTSSSLSGGSASLFGGGASIVDSATVELQSTTVQSNAAGESGGGLSLEDTCTVVLDVANIQQNSAQLGGGLHIASTLSFQSMHSRYLSNTALFSGGGVMVEQALIKSSTVSFESDSFEQNQVPQGSGGAMAVSVSPNVLVSVTGGEFLSNRALQGGALLVNMTETTHLGCSLPLGLALSNSAFIANSAVQGLARADVNGLGGGGGIFWNGQGIVDSLRCLFAANPTRWMALSGVRFSSNAAVAYGFDYASS